MTTEEQAKQTLYCPMKFSGEWDNGRCMGADCAAWRWAAWSGEINVEGDRISFIPQRTGFCGIGGKP